MDAHEAFVRQQRLDSFHAHKRQHRPRLTVEIDLDIVFQTLNVQYVAHTNSDQAVFALNSDKLLSFVGLSFQSSGTLDSLEKL